MTLERSNDKSGLWIAAPPLVAGAHVLIVGISDYPFLGGGSAPVRERAERNGGLDQLEISALSAAGFFAWLRDAEEVAGAPLASCRLLLAPRDDERAEVERLTGGHYDQPDFDTLESAIKSWGDAVFNGGKSSGPNVALFFYSGHGVEVDASPAILARDFLNPKRRGAGAGLAVALDPLTRAIKTYGVDRALFLVDACRDSTQLVRELNVVGANVLDPSRIVERRPDGLITLRSTASGLKSYQLKSDPATLFSHAVLDALEGPGPSYDPYDTRTVPWQLLFSALEGHVKRKVAELLAERSALAVQSVEADGLPYNKAMLVARKKPPEAAPGPPVKLSIDSAKTGVTLSDAVDASARQILSNARSLGAEQIGTARTAGGTDVGDLVHPNIMHAVFGHETITDPWLQSLHLSDAESGAGVDSHLLQVVGAYNHESDERVTAWIDIAVKPRSGHALWIAAEGHDGAPSFAVVIPHGENSSMPVRLDVAFERKGDGWGMTDMSARLSDPNDINDPNLLPAWRQLWDAQRTEIFGNLGAATDLVRHTDTFVAILREKIRSPVAAAIATTYLVRCGLLDALHDWPRNLAEWFAWLPDGPVLWAETLIRRREKKCFENAASGSGVAARQAESADVMEACIGTPEYEEARRYFQMLAARRAPYLACSLGFAIRQAAFWRDALKRDFVAADDALEVCQACENVERAARYWLSGGVFSRFVAHGMLPTPDWLLGEKMSVPAAALG